MSKTISVWMPGKPFAWQRARTNGTRHYTGEKMASMQAAWAKAALAEMSGKDMLEGAISVEFQAQFEPPPSWSKKRKTAALLGEIPHTSKPDLDNLFKLVADACNGVVYKDDSQITTVSARKKYGTRGLTVCTFRSIPHARV